MLVERVGSNLEDLLLNRSDWVPSLKIAFEILREIIKNLKILHSMNIIHGDIHSGNIVRGLAGPERNEIFLIDYGLAKFYTRLLPEEPIHKPRNVSQLLTHWEMKGFAKSFRDDIFRSLLVFGALVGLRARWQALEAWKDRELFYRLYGEGDILTYSPEENPWTRLEKVSEENKEIIISEWKRIVKYVQKRKVNCKPNHDWIIRMIDRIISLFSDSG
jgi:serine/threonine protein kinase